MCLILLVVVRAAPGCFSWCKSQTMGTNSKNTLGKGAIAKEKVGQKNVWKFVPLRGGGVGRLMANAILNFHFDYLNPSLIENAQHLVISCHHDSFRFNNIFFSFNFKFIPGKLNSNIDLFMALGCHQIWKHL